MKKIIYNYKKLSMTIQNLYEPCIILIGNLENVGEQLNMSLNFFTGAAEGEGLPGLKPYHFCAFFFFLEWRELMLSPLLIVHILDAHYRIPISVKFCIRSLKYGEEMY